MSKLTIHLLLTLLAAALLLPGLGLIPLLDWDELNFAESAREMEITNQWWYVQMGFEPFWEKPPLAIALQALCVKLFGDHAWVYRLPNAMAGIVAINFVYHVGEFLGRRMLGIFWSLTLLTSLAPFIYWKTALIDPIFNLFIVLSLWNWYRIIRSEIHGERSNIYYLLSGIFIALAALTKGQAAFVLFAAVVGWITLYRGRWYDIITGKLVLFLLPIIVLVGGWSYNVYLQLGSSFFESFYQYQKELVKGQFEWHTQPWFYHGIVLLLACFPASALALKYLTRKGQEDFVLESWHFLMRSTFWIVLIIFSLISTKIIHYSSLCWWPITYFGAYHIYLVYTNRTKTSPGQWLWLLAISLVLSCVFLLGPIAINWISCENTEWWSKMDSYSRSILSQSPRWNWFTYLPAIALFFACGLSLRKMIRSSSTTFDEGTILLVSLVTGIAIYAWFLPAASETLHNPLALYCKKIDPKKELIETQGFKTYSLYYHGKFTPAEFNGDWYQTSDMVKEKIKGHPYPKQEARKVWIRDGSPKTPAYLITRNTYKPDLYFLYQFQKKDSFSGYWVWKRK